MEAATGNERRPAIDAVVAAKNNGQAEKPPDSKEIVLNLHKTAHALAIFSARQHMMMIYRVGQIK